MGGDVFKYFDADTMLLESEVGIARNEPVTFAVRKAIEAGVAEVIDQGAKKGLWKIKLPSEPVVPEAEVVTEEIKVELPPGVDLIITQGKPEKIKTRAEYLAEKEIKDYNKRKWLEVQAEKATLQTALELKEWQKEKRKILIQAMLNDNKAALEVIDESVITDTNTVTGNHY
jgi:hypothetical protein